MTSDPITTVKAIALCRQKSKYAVTTLMFTSTLTMPAILSSLKKRAGTGWKNSESFQWLSAHNIAFVVVNININYRRPAVLGDVLTVTSQVQQLNGKSGVLSQVVTLDPEGQVVADALITFVCIDLKTQKALPLEGALREKLELMIV